MVSGNKITVLNDILESLKAGSLEKITVENAIAMNNMTMEILECDKHTVDQIVQMGLIINISNILYNNTDKEILPLEDGVYDLLLVLYKKYNEDYQVGAEPIQFQQGSAPASASKELKKAVYKIDREKDILFMDNFKQVPVPIKQDYMRRAVFHNVKNKKSLDVEHKYPTLVGTLDKCKFVLNSQAIERGAFEDSNVQIFERDFIQKHIASGILNPTRKFYMIIELKYDGISVESEVSDRIISARTRGDTNQNIASDLTAVFGGYRFHRAVGHVPPDNIFGMKFEAIITNDRLNMLQQDHGKVYTNSRTAIIGLTGCSDAYKYRDYITLIPLATSLPVDRLTEVEFLNKYYNSGEYLRYAVLYGDYKEILFQVKSFVEEAEYMRAFIPFMYDGVVVSYIEPDLIDALGTKNSVNLYSMAIKFNALKKQTIFQGYTFSIGQNGLITPMIHYNPVEFYGTIHPKSSGHSYKRFLELGMRVGDIIDVEYTHDVMPYVTKPMNTHNANNPNPIIEFIKNCPSCGTELVISDSNKSAMCPNINCPERNIIRVTNMLQKLNLKDFSEETVRNVSRFSLSELMSLKREDVKFLGEVNSAKFIERIESLKKIPLYDYRIIGSLGFTSIAVEKWKTILNQVSLKEILSLDKENLRYTLLNIKGIGPMAVNTIIDELEFFINDLKLIASMPNIIISKGMKSGKSIRFSGIRDAKLAEILNNMGHDANDAAGVTKTTDILIVPHDSFTSSKTQKVGENTIIVPHDDFVHNMDKYL